jgi:hypothetical protein
MDRNVICCPKTLAKHPVRITHRLPSPKGGVACDGAGKAFATLLGWVSRLQSARTSRRPKGRNLKA